MVEELQQLLRDGESFTKLEEYAKAIEVYNKIMDSFPSEVKGYQGYIDNIILLLKQGNKSSSEYHILLDPIIQKLMTISDNDSDIFAYCEDIKAIIANREEEEKRAKEVEKAKEKKLYKRLGIIFGGIVLLAVAFGVVYYSVLVPIQERKRIEEEQREEEEFIESVKRSISNKNFEEAYNRLSYTYYDTSKMQELFYEVGVYYADQAAESVDIDKDSLEKATKCFKECKSYSDSSHYLSYCDVLEDFAGTFVYKDMYERLEQFDDIESANDLHRSLLIVGILASGKYKYKNNVIEIKDNGDAVWNDLIDYDLLIWNDYGYCMPLGIGHMYGSDHKCSFSFSLDGKSLLDCDDSSKEYKHVK